MTRHQGPADRDDVGPALPLDRKEAASRLDALQPLRSATHVAAAVSGGPDSMALALLVRDWAAARQVRLTALTVDHRLRPGAADEAVWVRAQMQRLGIVHETLVWAGEKPRSNVQALARRARYGLMDEWCAAHDAAALLLAHHLEDQAETVLLRLGRGSGVYGLAGMAAEAAPAYPGAPTHVRPFLAVPRARLRATLQAAGEGWIDDPSNANLHYRRVRVRALWPKLAAVGITPARLARTADHMARARAALEGAVNNLLEQGCQTSEAGYALLDVQVLKAAPDEIALRALSRVLGVLGGHAYGPRFEALERLWDRINTGAIGSGATLAGCRIIPQPDGSLPSGGALLPGGALLIAREARSMEGRLRLGPARQVWDGRYLVQADASAPPLWIDRLGRGNLKTVREGVDQRIWAAVPAPARPVLPGIFDARGLVAVPAIGYGRACDRVRLDYLPRYRLPPRAYQPHRTTPLSVT